MRGHSDERDAAAKTPLRYTKRAFGRTIAQAFYRSAGGVPTTIGHFATQEAAAHAYNATITSLGLQSVRNLNRVDEKGRLVPKPGKKPPAVEPSDSEKKSRYYGRLQCEKKSRPRRRRDPLAGVSYYSQTRKFRAQYSNADGKQKLVGYFDNQEDAARAYNSALKEHGLVSIRKVNKTDAAGRLVEKAAESSKYYGVSWHRASSQYRAFYSDARGKRVYVGRFNDEDDAARAYNSAVRRHNLQSIRRLNKVNDA